MKRQPETKQKNFLSAECDSELNDRVNIVAGILGISKSELIRKAVEYYISNILKIELTLSPSKKDTLTLLFQRGNGSNGTNGTT